MQSQNFFFTFKIQNTSSAKFWINAKNRTRQGFQCFLVLEALQYFNRLRIQMFSCLPGHFIFEIQVFNYTEQYLATIPNRYANLHKTLLRFIQKTLKYNDPIFFSSCQNICVTQCAFRNGPSLAKCCFSSDNNILCFPQKFTAQ